MSLRSALVELLGAEVQQHPVTLNGRTVPLHFRQISDAQGREVFRIVEGESSLDRGRRTMIALVEASACDASGKLISEPGEVEALPSAALDVLFQAAAATNNLTLISSRDTAEGVEGALAPNG